LLLGFAVVPGFPKLPFIFLALLTGGLSYFIQQEQGKPNQLEDNIEENAEATASVAEAESMTDLLQIDTLEVEIGYGLIPLVESNSNTSLLNRIMSIRRQIAMELGFIIPKIRIRDNLQLGPNNYSIKLRGEEIADGKLMVGYFLAIPSGQTQEQVPGIATTEPAFGLPAVWIENSYKERAEATGYTVVDPASVIGTHLTEVIRTHAPEILTRQDTKELLDNLKKNYSALVDDLVPQILSLGEVHEVLKNLLHERVSIRDMVTILEGISSAAPEVKDVNLITEAVRQRLARMISNQYRAIDGAMHVITLSPRVERLLADSIEYQNHNLRLNLEPRTAQKLMEITSSTAASPPRLAA
jgi:flagellar biosynthesis protein FlhA